MTSVDVGSLPVVPSDPYQDDGVTPAPALLAAIEAHRLVVPDGLPVPMVVRHADVQRAERDPRLRSAGLQVMEIQGIVDGPIHERIAGSILAADGPAHRRLRRLVTAALTPRMVNDLRPLIREVVDGLVDDALAQGPTVDAFAALARPLPGRVISRLLGIPGQAMATFERNAAIVLGLLRFGGDIRSQLPAIEQALAENDALMTELLAERRAHPGDDLLSGLAAAREGDDVLGIDEICVLASDLMTAGTETTRNQLALSLRLFCDHPEQWRALRSDPGLLSGAVDECLRRLPATAAVPRMVAEDAEVAGAHLPAGSFLIMSSVAANLDATVFPDPVRFDVSRDAGAHVTFGAGPHHCLGSHLAKVELTEALDVLCRRIATVELAGEVTWRPGVGQRAIASLPLRLSPASPA